VLWLVPAWANRRARRDHRGAVRRRLLAERARHAVHGPKGAAPVQRWRLDLHDRVERFAQGIPQWSVYAASKAVLSAYARVWVSELRDRKIRVNVLIPGQVASRCWRR